MLLLFSFFSSLEQCYPPFTLKKCYLGHIGHVVFFFPFFSPFQIPFFYHNLPNSELARVFFLSVKLASVFFITEVSGQLPNPTSEGYDILLLKTNAITCKSRVPDKTGKPDRLKDYEVFTLEKIPPWYYTY